MSKLKVLDLFSGIGGFSLGLERTNGFETVAFCEIEPFPRKVLAKHWPGVPCYEDVRTLTAERLAADGISVDVICGGFPCQDISSAGRGAGITGVKSGLWSEYSRLIGELRPKFVLVENVAALLGRGLNRVLGDLAALGYDAEWHCIPASAVGAPHRRDRVWIVAYAPAQRSSEARSNCQHSAKWLGCRLPILADAQSGQTGGAKSPDSGSENDIGRAIILSSLGRCDILVGSEDWHSEPSICRVADGISSNVDRVSALGNAVVPQIPELIGRAILDAMEAP